MFEVSHRLFNFAAKLLLATVDLTTFHHFQSSVESITKLSIFLRMFVCNQQRGVPIILNLLLPLVIILYLLLFFHSFLNTC